MTTPVCEMLGIERPIVQAPMAAVPRLAAAVSNGLADSVRTSWTQASDALCARAGAAARLSTARERRLDRMTAQPTEDPADPLVILTEGAESA